MRNWKKIVGMLLIMAVWLGLMWRLSTENGTETLKDSMRFARKFGAWIYGEPTAAQLDHLNLVLRKMAHVFLYAVFGGMLAVFWQLLLRHKVWRILGAIGGHDGKVKPAGPVGTQTALHDFGQQAIHRHALHPGCAAQPDAAVLAVLDRHRRQHGRGLAVFFQHQNIFQSGDVLQPARRIDGVRFGSPAAQRRQRGQIISGSLTQHGHHLFL